MYIMVTNCSKTLEENFRFVSHPEVRDCNSLLSEAISLLMKVFSLIFYRSVKFYNKTLQDGRISRETNTTRSL